MTRPKKPPVKPETRQDWLYRSELGESPPRIAKEDGFDARTVRKHIELAKNDRENKEARSGVLRSALESHYADLCRYIETLARDPNQRVSLDGDLTGSYEPMEYWDQLGIALHQHIPRSPIWKYLNEIPKLRTLKSELKEKLDNKIEAEVEVEPHLPKELITETGNLTSDIIVLLKGQIYFWLDDRNTVNIEKDLRVERIEGEKVRVFLGSNSIGLIRQDQVKAISNNITGWMIRIRTWPEFIALKKTVHDLEQAQKELREEVAFIVLRRVVPGRCRYCPV
jgi:hypothetical protein